MTTAVNEGFEALSRFKLWVKINNGDALDMADFPELISLRWTFFRDNWEYLKDQVLQQIPDADYPDRLKHDIEAFSRLIEVQRSNTNRSVNPLARSSAFSKYYALWAATPIDVLPLNKQETKIIQNKLNEIGRYTRSDFVNIRKHFQLARDSIADTIGLSDADYNVSFSRRAGAELKDAKLKDIESIQVFQALIFECDTVLANAFSLSSSTVDPFALARANANNPGINISTYSSGTFVKMEFGESLQSLAAKYLGDPDRWMEIAIANGLKAPYIDEIGEFVPMLSSGSNTLINIAAFDSNGFLNSEKFFIGQPIFLSSDVYRFPEQREIINITEVPISNELVIELSGEPDLHRYQLADNAGARVYKQNTLNSNFLVLIPTVGDPGNPPNSREPFFLQSKKEDEKKAGVDLFLNNDLDLSFTSSNDIKLSYGLNNSTQAITLKMISEQGQLFRHPSFGLPALQGTKSTERETAQQLLANSIVQLVENDDRFERIESLGIELDNTTETGSFLVQLVVRMSGSNSLVPISFSVKAG